MTTCTMRWLHSGQVLGAPGALYSAAHSWHTHLCRESPCRNPATATAS